MHYLQNPGTFAALAFLSGQSPDREGRYVMEYYTFTPERWEECHNHVQWAFPSSVPSDFNPHAPVIDFNDFLRHTFVDGSVVDVVSEEIYCNLGQLMEDYIDSLGIGITDAGSFFLMQQSHPERLAWLDNPRDHNHRRLTRLFMMWHHLQEPIKLTASNPVVKHFEPLYHYISNYVRCCFDSEIDETLTYWDRAFHQGTN